MRAGPRRTTKPTTAKSHINAGQEHKLIQDYEVTHAAVHESRVFEDLLDQTVDDNGDKRPVYADSATVRKSTKRRWWMPKSKAKCVRKAPAAAP